MMICHVLYQPPPRWCIMASCQSRCGKSPKPLQPSKHTEEATCTVPIYSDDHKREPEFGDIYGRYDGLLNLKANILTACTFTV